MELLTGQGLFGSPMALFKGTASTLLSGRKAQSLHPVAERILRDPQEIGRFALIEFELAQHPLEDPPLNDIEAMVNAETDTLLDPLEHAIDLRLLVHQFLGDVKRRLVFRFEDAPLDRLLQLPHIALPLMADKDAHSINVDDHIAEFVFLPQILDKMLHQIGDVFWTLPEGWHIEHPPGFHLQIQAFVETPFAKGGSG